MGPDQWNTLQTCATACNYPWMTTPLRAWQYCRRKQLIAQTHRPAHRQPEIRSSGAHRIYPGLPPKKSGRVPLSISLRWRQAGNNILALNRAAEMLSIRSAGPPGFDSFYPDE